MKDFYILHIEGDVDPELKGPYNTHEERDKAAVELRRDDPEGRNGIFRLDISAKQPWQEPNGKVEVGSYSNAELES